MERWYTSPRERSDSNACVEKNRLHRHGHHGFGNGGSSYGRGLRVERLQSHKIQSSSSDWSRCTLVRHCRRMRKRSRCRDNNRRLSERRWENLSWRGRDCRLCKIRRVSDWYDDFLADSRRKNFCRRKIQRSARCRCACYRRWCRCKKCHAHNPCRRRRRIFQRVATDFRGDGKKYRLRRFGGRRSEN